jgi:hypothetical protein
MSQRSLFVATSLALLLNCSKEQTEVEIEDTHASVEVTGISLEDLQPGASASLARNLYFIFDGSGSMLEAPDSGCRGDRSFANKLAGAQWAVGEFLKVAPADVQLGLFVFDGTGTRERVPLGKDNRQAFMEAILGVQAGGSTPLYEAMVFGADQLIRQYRQQLGYGEFRLVVVTDGEARMVEEASLYAVRHGLPIYAIGLCVAQNHPLRRFATSYRAADTFEALQAGLEETLAELPSFDVSEFESVEENPQP